MKCRAIFWMAGLVAAMLTTGSLGRAHAADFPTKPVRIIVQTAAGSGIDVLARILADNLTRRWNQQVVILNQPGAGGAIAARALSSAPNDGYTLFFAASSVFVVLPELQKDLAPIVRSFTPLAFFAESPFGIAVSAKTPANTLAELLDLIAKTPGGLNCAVSTRGGLSHLSAESLKAAAKAQITFIHYPGTAPALTDVFADRVPMVMDGVTSFIGPAAGGQIKLLAVSSPSRLKSLPNVPAVSETLPDFEATAWFALVGPAGLDPQIAHQISSATQSIVQDPNVVSRLEELGAFTRAMSADDLARYIEAQKQKWAPIVQSVGG